MNKAICTAGLALLVSLASAASAQGFAADSQTSPQEQQEERRANPIDRAVPPLERPVTLTLDNVPLAVAIRAIDQQADLRLGYTDRILPVGKRVSLDVRRVAAGKALARVLEGTGVVVQQSADGQLTLVKQKVASAPADSTAYVGGAVVRAGTAEPLVAATVIIRGTSLSATTNEHGHYGLDEVPRGSRTITVRLIGYKPVTRTVAVNAPDVIVNFELEPQTAYLEELVTTATGSQRRLELGNAITTIRVDSVLQAAPIKDLTDLLETRVPGLTVQATSGAPGDPGRLRLRGVHSVFRSNDPIIIVDGVRIYSDQSATRSGNLADFSPDLEAGIIVSGGNVAAPSPLDQIDPNSVETIEVFNGPSAATMYGADAANGVIVITTKRGRPGPARWTASISHGRSAQPGEYPLAYFRWGHDPLGGPSVICPLQNLTCVQDSLVRFQALNDPALSVYDVGRRSAASLGVSGGSETLQYAVSGSYQDETGLLRLPRLELDRFRVEQGRGPPDWMQRPHHFASWSATGAVTARLGPTAKLALTTQLARTEQRRSSLENQLGTLSATYADLVNNVFYRARTGVTEPATTFLEEYYQRTTASSVGFTNGLSFGWDPRPWLNVAATAGLNVINRDDESLTPRELRTNGDTLGRLSRGTGRSLVSTVGARASFRVPLGRDIRLTTSVGANYTGTTTSDLMSQGSGLLEGTNSLNGAEDYLAGESRSNVASFGWYLEPSLAIRHLYLSTGFRFDGGSTYGAAVKLTGFPKVSVSWALSEEPFFPLRGLFSTFRVRAAYGQAGVQPGVTDRLRLYTKERGWLDGTFADHAVLTSLGNTQLRPERSTEIEGGVDATLFDDLVSLSLSGYRTTQRDALMPLPLPPSVLGRADVLTNVGVIRNTGVEVSLGVTPVRGRVITWSATLDLARNRNEVVELGRGVTPFPTRSGDWIRPGYPLFGRWTRPILGYADRDGDGVIRVDEIQVGDTLVYMGDALPNYNASLHTTVSLFNGALAVGATFNYQDDLTQLNSVAGDNGPLSRGYNDPTAPLGEQAAVAAATVGGGGGSNYGLMQTVSTFRFNSLSVHYSAPRALARALGAEALSIAVQGSNLALHTAYRGLDPHVNAQPTGNGYIDQGGLPQPREWSVSLHLSY